VLDEKMRKISKISLVLFLSLFTPAFMLGDATKVNACSKWNPFCNLGKNPRLKPSSGKPVPSQPQAPPPSRNLSDYYSPNLTFDKSPVAYISKSFTKDETVLIEASLVKLQEILKNEDVYKCINSSTTKKSGDVGSSFDPLIYNGKNPGAAVSSFLGNPKANANWKPRPKLLFIDRINMSSGDKKNVLGEASVPRVVHGMPDFIISLNAYNLNLPDHNKKWTAVIIHEMLHNLGYSHADVINNNFDPIQGNFVYEAGYCAFGEGKRDVFLNDVSTNFFVD
jgi:hypothetical protein